MRWCRIRFVLLGLLLCVVHVVNGTCGQRFIDPASSALLSDVVLEGKVKKTSVTGSEQIYNITVAIRKSVLKGAELVKATKKISIGRFKNGAKDPVNCIGSVQEGRTYFFFLKDSGHSKGLHLEIIAMPVKKTKSVATELRKILCDQCAQTPIISKLTGPDSLPIGTRATLTCAAESKPNPEFSWYKDGVLLPHIRKGRVRIKSRKRQSTLQIRNATQNDTGTYECVAANAIGQIRKSFTVKVHQYPTNGHRQKCPKQTYCLNGGTCLYIRDMVKEFCLCPEQWAGRRCELLDAISVRTDYSHQASLLFERTLIIIGIVIAVLVFIIICIASYILAKNRRKCFEDQRKRKGIQRRNQQPQPILVDKCSNKPTDKESDKASGLKPSDVSPKHRLLKQQESPICFNEKTSQRNLSELLLHDNLSDVKVNPKGLQHESRQRLAASSVYENIADAESQKHCRDGDFLTYKSIAATVHPENIEMSVLETRTEDSMADADMTNITGSNDYVDHPATITPLLSHLSVSDSPHRHHQIVEAILYSDEPTPEPSEPLLLLYSSLLSSPQPVLSHQHFINDASSMDENATSTQPILFNHNKQIKNQHLDYPLSSFVFSGDKDPKRYVQQIISTNMHPNSHESFDSTNIHLPTLTHSNTFPKTKTNGLALDMFSESDDEYQTEIPYEKQLHISEEDLMVSHDNLHNNSFFTLTTPTRQTSHEELVIGLLPNSFIPRPGMRKYQSEEGSAYGKLNAKNVAFLQLDTRCRSLEDNVGAEDSPDRMRLNSTMAGSPDVETYDNMGQQPMQLHNYMYSYDPNDDSTPWDGDINKADFTHFAKEDRDRTHRLKDVLPDQQPIPI